MRNMPRHSSEHTCPPRADVADLLLLSRTDDRPRWRHTRQLHAREREARTLWQIVECLVICRFTLANKWERRRIQLSAGFQRRQGHDPNLFLPFHFIQVIGILFPAEIILGVTGLMHLLFPIATFIINLFTIGRSTKVEDTRRNKRLANRYWRDTKHRRCSDPRISWVGAKIKNTATTFPVRLKYYS